MQHLILRLEAPLMAFGGEAIDNYGVIRRFPSASMLTGLLANALGWRRAETKKHQGLQYRLVFAARIDREPAGGMKLRDYQTAAINRTERAWTTRGYPEGRRGGTYQIEERYRDYWADMCVTIALRLKSPDGSPTLAELEAALQEPARPLFIGRKPCLPSGPLYQGIAEADTVLGALLEWPLAEDNVRREDDERNISALWPTGEGVDGIREDRSVMVTDQRNWVSGLHGGGRRVCEGAIPRDRFSGGQAQAAPDDPAKEEL